MIIETSVISVVLSRNKSQVLKQHTVFSFIIQQWKGECILAFLQSVQARCWIFLWFSYHRLQCNEKTVGSVGQTELTRKHSSRMRTACCSSSGWGVCLTILDADPSDADPSVGRPPWMQTPPWTEGMTHAFWKYSLPATTVSGGNNISCLKHMKYF